MLMVCQNYNTKIFLRLRLLTGISKSGKTFQVFLLRMIEKIEVFIKLKKFLKYSVLNIIFLIIFKLSRKYDESDSFLNSFFNLITAYFPKKNI